MVVHYKQLARRFNTLRTKKRYKEKRIRRAFLTEAFNDGELAMYKPTHKPLGIYSIYTDKWKPEEIKKYSDAAKIGGQVLADAVDKALVEKYSKPVKFNWFEKFLLWIKKW